MVNFQASLLLTNSNLEFLVFVVFLNKPTFCVQEPGFKAYGCSDTENSVVKVSNV